MHPQSDEKALVQQAQQGSSDALGTLYEQHVDAVYRFMFYRTGDAMVAEDLTAEVFADIVSSLSRYRERGLPFRAWVFRIARARLADYWRKTKRREKYQHIMGEAEAATWTSQFVLEEHFAYEGLQQAFEYLTPAETEVVILRFAGGLTHQEIAAVIHSNANAVKSKMRRALDKLRQILERQEDFNESRGQL